jgi:hypothetical protein
MQRLLIDIHIPLEGPRGLTSEQREEMEDLLHLAEELDYIYPEWRLELGSDGFGQGGTLAHASLRFKDAEFQGEVILNGLRGALKKTDEVQAVLSQHPGSTARDLILNLFE